jgi:hypothetical protein
MSDIDVESAIGEPPADGPTELVGVVQRPKKGKDRKGKMPLAQEVRRPIGRPPGSTNAPKAAEAAEAPPAPVSHKKIDRAMNPTDVQSKSALERWPVVLAWLADQGLGPDAAVIRVSRIQLGGFGAGPGVPTQMHPPIDGSTVAGNEQLSPGDDLSNAILQLYHLGSGRRGAAKYDCEFNYKVPPRNRNGGSTICRGDVVFDDPETIEQQQRRAAEYLNTRRGTASAAPSRGFAGMPQYAQPPLSQAPPPSMQTMQGGDPQLAELRRDMARIIGSRDTTEEMRLMLAQALAQVSPATVQAPPPAPVPQVSDQERQWIEEGRFRMMAERLGYVRADAVGVAAPPPAAVPPPAVAVATGVTDPLAGLNGLIKGLEGLELLKPRLAKLVGIQMPEPGEEGEEEAPAAKAIDTNPLGLQEVPVTRFLGQPVMFPTKADGIVETIQSFLMANPHIAMEGLSRLSSVFTSDAFSALIARLTGAPAQAAARVVAQGVTGTGTQSLTNGAAAHAALAPLAQQAPIPGPPPRYRGPTA